MQEDDNDAGTEDNDGRCSGEGVDSVVFVHAGHPGGQDGARWRLRVRLRGLPNPFWEEGLRKFSGKDAEVRAFFDGYRDEVEAFAGAAEALVRQTIRAYQACGKRHLMVAFGCTGGQHRSVFMAQELARRLQGMSGVETKVMHMAEGRWEHG